MWCGLHTAGHARIRKGNVLAASVIGKWIGSGLVGVPQNVASSSRACVVFRTGHQDGKVYATRSCRSIEDIDRIEEPALPMHDDSASPVAGVILEGDAVPAVHALATREVEFAGANCEHQLQVSICMPCDIERCSC